MTLSTNKTPCGLPTDTGVIELQFQGGTYITAWTLLLCVLFVFFNQQVINMPGNQGRGQNLVQLFLRYRGAHSVNDMQFMGDAAAFALHQCGQVYW